MQSYPFVPTSFVELQVEINTDTATRADPTSVNATATVTWPDGRTEATTLGLAGLPTSSEIAATEGLAILRGASDPSGLLRDVGRRLFRALFGGPLRRSYAHAVELAGPSGAVALRIVTSDPTLVMQPWELLVDDELRRTSDFLALAGWPVVRGLAGLPPDEERPSLERLRVLVLVAVLPLPVERDGMLLNGIASANPPVEVTVAEVRTAADVNAALQRDVDVVHYAGAGGSESRSAQSSVGPDMAATLRLSTGVEIDAVDLGTALEARPRPRLVVLNGGLTDRAAAVLAASVPSVVGLRGNALGDACIEFADGLYRTLAAGGTARAAVVAGRQQVQYRFPQDRYWSLPVHYDRGDTTFLGLRGPSRGDVLGPSAATPDETTSLLLEEKAMAERNLAVLQERLTSSTQTLPPTLTQQERELVDIINQLDQQIEARGT